MSRSTRIELAEHAIQLSLNAGTPASHKMMDNDVRDTLQSGLTDAHKGNSSVYLHGFTPTHAVYSRYDSGEQSRSTYSRPYSIDQKNKQASFGKSEKKVRLTTEITPLQSGEGGSDSAEGENRFMGNTASNRQQQETSMTDINAGSSSSAATIVNAATSAPPKPLSMEQFLGSVPQEYRDIVTQGIKMHTSHKSGLIAKLKANKANKFTDVQLNGFDTEMLENLVALSVEPEVSPFNYAGAGGGSNDAMRQQALERGLTTNAASGDEFFAAAPPRLGLVANKELIAPVTATTTGAAATTKAA